MKQHLASSQSVAAGLRVLPATAGSFAAAQAAWRFYHNSRVALPQLAEPLISRARRAISERCQDYALVVHDWSGLHYSNHTSKEDRTLLYHPGDFGYELQTALTVADSDGAPLAPVYLGLRATDEVYSTRRIVPLPVRSGLDELGRTINHVELLNLGKPLVHIVDREGDSVLHLRRWQRQQRFFLLRSNDLRRVEHKGESCLLSEVVASLIDDFKWSREVSYKGQKAQQYVAETKVTLTRPAKLRRRKAGGESRSYVSGKPLNLRLIVAEVRDAQGQQLAQWLLWSNLPETVSPATLALWYYWRWQIESFFKLLKRGGQHLEQWQQESAEAIARRLLIAAQACVIVWTLAQSEDEQAKPLRQLLVRLSGRLMKRGVAFTTPALLAGMWNLLAIIDALDEYTLDELRQQGKLIRQIIGLQKDGSH